VTALVDPTEIEALVGAHRHLRRHLGRATRGTVYILHSQDCLDSGIDLRECWLSLALDRGIDMRSWRRHLDQTVALDVYRERLVPRPVQAGVGIRLIGDPS
jgi:hypothetical protein